MSSHVEAEAIVHELFRTEAGRRDPYPRLHRLRKIAPIHRSEVAHAWLLTGYEDCQAVLRDPRFGKRFAHMLDGFMDTWRDHPSLASLARMMIQLDAPEHTRLRRKVTRTFTAKRVLALRPRIETAVAELLEEASSGEGDLLTSLAFQLPITVIGDLLGMDRADLPSFRQPATDLTLGFESRVTPAQRAAADDASRFIDDYFTKTLQTRRETPGDDLLSQLAIDEGDDALTDRELLDMAALLLVAGFETTTNVISAGLLTLHDQPEQLAYLRAGGDLTGIADEFLRHEASVQTINRVALEDVAIGDQVIAAGEQVLVMLGAANRDPTVFPDPDRLDFSRSRPKHVTFGGGIHHCVGAALARLELEVLLEQLAARFASIELAGARPQFRDSLTFRATESLPLRLRSASDGAVCPVAQPVRPAAGDAQDAAWRDGQRAAAEADPPELTPAELASRVALLESQPLLSACRASELVNLAATAYVLTFDEGEVLMRHGAVSEDAFLVLEGQAEVTIDGEVVATLGVDDLVGERGVVTGTPRAATVTATSHLAALVLSRARLGAVIAGNPAAAATMLAVTAARYPVRTPI